MVRGAVACSVFLFCLQFLLTICSGCRKGPDEDDGFWEVYNLFWRTHIVITMVLLTVMLLWIPAVYAFVIVLLDTMADVKFF